MGFRGSVRRRVGRSTVIILMVLGLLPGAPVAAADPTVVGIAAGWAQGCIWASDGTGWCWGMNGYGELGDGSRVNRSTAVRVTRTKTSPLLPAPVLAPIISMSGHMAATCAARADGSAWCFGSGGAGELGHGKLTGSLRAVRVVKQDGSPLTGVEQVAAGLSFACARTSAGVAWCWGKNDVGQLGSSDTGAPRPSAARVTVAGGAVLKNVVGITAGALHACARLADETVWCWGGNDGGPLGDGTETSRSYAAQVRRTNGTPFSGATGISAGNEVTCARTGAGAAWCWGRNHMGQLGDGTEEPVRLNPVRVRAVGGSLLTGVLAVATKNYNGCARMEGGTMMCWGPNNLHQLGDGTTAPRVGAVQVLASEGTPFTGVAKISLGDDFTCAATTNGRAYCWGRGDTYRIGDGEGGSWDRVFPTGVVPSWAE